MKKKKIYLSNLSWNQKDTLKVLNKIKKYNLDGIDIAPLKISKNWSNIEKKVKKFYKILKSHNLKVNAVQGIFYKTNLNVFENSKDNFKNIFHHVKLIFKICKITKCHKIIIGSSDFRNPKNISNKQADLIFYFFLKKAHKYLRKEKIYFCLEAIPIQYGEKYLYDINHLIKIVKKVKSPWIKINLDTSIFHFKRLDMKQINKNANLIKNIQITESNFDYLENISKNNKLFLNKIKTFRKLESISLEIIKHQTNLLKIDNSLKKLLFHFNGLNNKFLTNNKIF